MTTKLGKAPGSTQGWVQQQTQELMHVDLDVHHRYIPKKGGCTEDVQLYYTLIMQKSRQSLVKMWSVTWQASRTLTILSCLQLSRSCHFQSGPKPQAQGKELLLLQANYSYISTLPSASSFSMTASTLWIWDSYLILVTYLQNMFNLSTCSNININDNFQIFMSPYCHYF